MKAKKHPLARDASQMKDKRFNKIFSKAFQEAPENKKDEIMDMLKQPDMIYGDINMQKQNFITDIVQDYVNSRAKRRAKSAALTAIPSLAGSAVSATSRQPRYVPGVSGAPGPHRLTNLERFARMLGLGPY